MLLLNFFVPPTHLGILYFIISSSNIGEKKSLHFSAYLFRCLLPLFISCECPYPHFYQYILWGFIRISLFYFMVLILHWQWIPQLSFGFWSSFTPLLLTTKIFLKKIMLHILNVMLLYCYQVTADPKHILYLKYWLQWVNHNKWSKNVIKPGVGFND